MSDEIIDLQSLDLSSTETGFPLLPNGVYGVRVVEIKTEQNKKQTGDNLKIKLALLEPTTDINGKPVNAGFPLFDLVSLVITKKDDGSVKYDPRPKLAEFKEAMTGTKTGSFNPLEQYIGLEGSVRLKVEKSEEYGDSNRVQKYIKKA